MTFTPDTVHLMSGTLDTTGFGGDSTALGGVGVVFDDLEADGPEIDGEPGPIEPEVPEDPAGHTEPGAAVDVPLFDLPGLQLNPDAVVAPVVVGITQAADTDTGVPQLPVITDPAPVVTGAATAKRQQNKRPSRAKPKP